MGSYQSDSDNDDSEDRKKSSNIITTGNLWSTTNYITYKSSQSLHSVTHTFFKKDWTQCTDASTGHPYYWNIVTKEVTWEIPTDYRLFLEEAAKHGSQFLKKWILCYTDDNAPYFFNEITREISWDKPEDFTETESIRPANKQTTGHENAVENVSVLLISKLLCRPVRKKTQTDTAR